VRYASSLVSAEDWGTRRSVTVRVSRMDFMIYPPGQGGRFSPVVLLLPCFVGLARNNQVLMETERRAGHPHASRGFLRNLNNLTGMDGNLLLASDETLL
jgi:hypothetical protein